MAKVPLDLCYFRVIFLSTPSGVMYGGAWLTGGRLSALSILPPPAIS